MPEEKRGLWADRKRRNAVFGAAGGVVLIVAIIIGFVAFRSGANDDRPTVTKKSAPGVTAAPTTTLPPGVNPIAEVTVPQIGVYEAPGAPAPKMTLDNPWLLNGEADKAIPQVFLVEEQRPDGWVRVLLPERPNGSSGWVRQSEVKLTQNPYHMKVNLRDHKITVSKGTEEFYSGPVAIGAAATPTPPGKYYIRVLLQTPDPKSVYGPYAYGLSAHSEVLTEFNGGDGEVGVHGNNDSSVLGKSVTHGCVRMDNEQITRLSKMLPLGTPVEIVS